MSGVDDGIHMPQKGRLSLDALVVENDDGSVALMTSVAGTMFTGEGADFNEAYFALKAAIWKGQPK